ncbi:putative invertase inhibitor [Curcuma longa]|uniref:putative invertase inhibitor n=1 Tax=Curcuma longa TaxID=136217 RepID=UPI003D9E5FEC
MIWMMRPQPYFRSLFLLLCLLRRASSDLVGDSCGQIAAGDPNVDYAFCVASLRPSAGATARDLAAAAARLAAANATRADAAAAAAMRGRAEKMGRYERSCLESCRELFAGAAEDLSEAAGMVEGGRSADAGVRLSAAVDAPVTCEEGFREGGIASPLAAEDGDLFRLAVIALAINARLK